MQLPARLRDTTLGDLLATLHRGYASGVLELTEGGRTHAVHLRRGLVHAVEGIATDIRFGDLATRAGVCARPVVEGAAYEARTRGWRIGHQLVAHRAMSLVTRDRLLSAQRAQRLEALYALDDATLRFHPNAAPLPAGSTEQLPMNPRETFHGRARRRERGARQRPPEHIVRCLAVLGLAPEASSAEVRARYRERVRALHPDRGGVCDEAQLAALRAVLDAWKTLANYASS